MFRNRASTLRHQRMLGEGERELFATGRAPAVVALHGFSGTAAELLPVLRALADAGFAVDAALLAGHGARVEDLQEQTFDSWLGGARARYQGAVEEHGRAVLLGFSLGSLLAMQLASERPAGLAGLVVLGNALTVGRHTSLPFRIWDLFGYPLPDAYLLKPKAGNLVDPSAMGTLVSYDRHPIRSAHQVFRAGARVLSVVGRIDCPALILHGRKDIVCSWKNAELLADRIGSADVTVRIFERSAHVLACDGERGEVAREVVRFVGRV